MVQRSLVAPTEAEMKAARALVESLMVEGHGETLYTLGVGGQRRQGVVAAALHLVSSHLTSPHQLPDRYVGQTASPQG